MELIWLYIPDFRKNGMLASITKISATTKNLDELSITDEIEPYWK